MGGCVGPVGLAGAGCRRGRCGMSADFVLWGSHPRYAGGVPIRLTAGSPAHCRRELRWRQGDGGWVDLKIVQAGKAHGLMVTPSGVSS